MLYPLFNAEILQPPIFSSTQKTFVQESTCSYFFISSISRSSSSFWERTWMGRWRPRHCKLGVRGTVSFAGEFDRARFTFAFSMPEKEGGREIYKHIYKQIWVSVCDLGKNEREKQKHSMIKVYHLITCVYILRFILLQTKIYFKGF